MGTCQGKEENTEKVDLSIDALESTTTPEDQIVTTSNKQSLRENAQEEENPVLEATQKDEKQAVEGSTCIVSIGMVRGCREFSWLPKAGPGNAGPATSEFYVVVRTEDKDDELFKTQPTKNTIWPSWKETSTIPWQKGDNLEFELMEILHNSYDIKGQIKESQHIVSGRGVLPSKDFENGGYNGIVTLDSRAHMETQLKVKVRLPGKDFPPDTEMEFTLSFDKAGGKLLAMDLDQSDGKTLCVKGVKDGGLVSAHNKEAPPEKRIKLRDFIVSVNGKNGSSAEMFEELKSAEKVELSIARPMELAIGVPPFKKTVLHGIEFSKEVTTEWLMVTNIKDGLNAAEYNALEGMKDLQLLPGDRMTRAFSTKAGFGSDIIRTARYSSGLQCEVFRPFDPSHPAAAWYCF